ncbi:MAG TPA: serine/threonine-protein kinase [Polyangiaceae bacterium]|nr:serine/threonine-protein kinase [Polyangiaceae bacterium]
MTPTIGSVVANKFQLVRELGRGSMGAVWLADHLALDVRCAVKFMTGDASRDPNFLSRFAFEARAIAQLQSPYVVRVLDYAVDHDVPFIAMEFLQGEDLCARLSRAGRLGTQPTYRIVSQIARGLFKAHLAGVVHRDLKPENIFLAQEDEGEVAKLLDFGVAKSTAFAVHGTATQAGSLLGTPAYMSPEQARGLREIDHRSDLWSLAVITYQCLTGKLPFDSPTLGDLFALIMYEPMPVPSRTAPWLSRDFDAWWAKAAARNAEDRFSDARELADALGDALGIDRGETAGRTETWRAEPEVLIPPPEAPAALPSTDVEPPASPDSRIISTHASLTRSLRGARQLFRDSPRARYVAACTGSVFVAFLLALVGTRGEPHPPVAHAASMPAIAPPAAPAPEPVQSPRPSALDGIPVETLPQVVEPSFSGSTSGPKGMAKNAGPGGLQSASRSSVESGSSAASRSGPHKGAHGASKGTTDDVDFGI